ncbi:MAG TPA: hypothetical protein VMV79_03670 [Alphaproteobacteria bacterium]|nr:hypothetical protein [Alphaproteobacteria bacterium]
MIRVSSILFWFGLIIAASLALYHTSDRVHALNMQLRTLDGAIQSERQDIHVLRAEWVYLSTPERVKQESEKFLSLRPTITAQVIPLRDLDAALPTRAAVAVAEAAPAPAAHTAPAMSRKVATRHNIISRHRRVAASAPEDFGHRIVIERVAAHPAGAQGPDALGALIAELNARP